jgi:hypothetical protein
MYSRFAQVFHGRIGNPSYIFLQPWRLHNEKAFVSVGDTSVVVCDVGDDATVAPLLSNKRDDGPSWLTEEAGSHVRGELVMIEIWGPGIVILVRGDGVAFRKSH